jgi:hypothetical protein
MRYSRLAGISETDLAEIGIETRLLRMSLLDAFDDLRQAKGLVVE